MDMQEMQERAQAVLDRLLDGIKAHATEIATINFESRKIAVFVFEPCPEAAGVLPSFGWDGKNPVFEMPPRLASAVATDPVTFRWINRRTGPARIFVFMHGGTLLVNFDPEQGFYLEPGSTDAELPKPM